jgi:tRNA(Arg) A34 adenosine deaminase TadA
MVYFTGQLVSPWKSMSELLSSARLSRLWLWPEQRCFSESLFSKFVGSAGSAMITPDELMQLAVEKTREGISNGQTPFGCAIARGDQILAVCHNIVWQTTDITAHAEITAIRTACRTLGDIHLAGCVVVSTCEPCPMCMSALHWARVETVYYGATIADAADAGFNELPIAAQQITSLGRSAVKLQADLMRKECTALFDAWKAARGQAY